MQELKPEHVAHIIFAARRLYADGDVRESMRDLDDERSGEAPDINDEDLDAIPHEEHEHDPVYQDAAAFINNLASDEQCELIALAWLGRGDGTEEDWDDLVNLATERRTSRTADYLLSMNMLGEYLEDGMDMFGHQISDFEDEHA